jgi:hypothetical protein
MHVKHFGAFTFEPRLDSGRSRALHLRPCFVPSEDLEKYIRHRKSELPHKVNGSVYQQGVRMSYVNPVPVAHGCCLKVDFVRASIGVIFKAIMDLAMRRYNLRIAIDGVVTLSIIDRKLTYSFSPSILATSDALGRTWPLKSVTGPIGVFETQKGFWSDQSPVQTMIHSAPLSSRSDLGKLQIPDKTKFEDMKTKIDNLSKSSRDLYSIEL